LIHRPPPPPHRRPFGGRWAILALFLVACLAILGFDGLDQSISFRPKSLQSRIASFYDRTSHLWEVEWGEHMHHGYYPLGHTVRGHSAHIAAQEDMIERILAFGNAGGLKGELRILDAGCGIGGSSRYLARKFPQARVVGITLSPYQRARAEALTAAAGLSDRVEFKVMDAMHTEFADNTFDLVYSMESGEHMPDKAAFVGECARVLKPGSPLVMAVWCHREVPPALRRSESRLLAKIYKVYALPYVCPLSDFSKFAAELSMRNILHEDWTANVKPFWGQVIRRALRPSGFLSVLRSGPTAIRAAWAAWWMHVAVEQRLFVFGAFTATKSR